MKFKLLFFLFLILFTGAKSQKLLDRVKKAAQRGVERTVERKVEQKSTNTTEDAMDTVLGNKKSSKSSTSEKSSSKSKKSDGLEEDSEGIEEEGSNAVGFKRGNRIIFQDDFTKDATGDFPARWSTTKGGEVKSLKNFGKYLKVGAGSIVYPELTKNLPQNFTVEFDLILPSSHPYRRPGIGFGIKPEPVDNLLASNNAVNFDIMSTEKSSLGYYELSYAESSIDYTRQKIDYTAPLDKPIHIAYEVNGKRIRMFVDGKKMVDLPTQFKDDYRKSFFLTSIVSGWAETKDAYFYVGNLAIAETGQDERSSVLKDLMEKGSFSTNAILFASGSDKIQSGSTDILNQIKDALDQSPSMKLKIVGHTDSDGDASGNLSLSKKRAAAVKAKLVSMGIDGSRLTTDGKGEEDPVADNSSSSGKAQNRRVEFIKI